MGKVNTTEREAQAHALVAPIERLPAEVLVVCGDFNALPGSRTFEILATLGLTDLVTTRGFTDTMSRTTGPCS